MIPIMSSAPLSTPAPVTLPVRTIPGSYGLPLLGPIADRLDYFWFQKPENFFTKRMEKHKSTVFRTNVPPCFPFVGSVNPNVVAVLDVKSFSHLFDMEIVEKANVLVGDFMPSVVYTGDMRVCAYLDTSEPKHAQIKNFSLDILKRSSKTWVPTLLKELDTIFTTFEADLSKSKEASLLPALQKFLSNFFSLTLLGADPSVSPEIANSGYIFLDSWLAIQLAPTVSIGVLQPLEEILVHSFAYPFFLVKGNYEKLVQFVKNEAKEVLNRAQTEFQLTEQEAIHNLLFILGFNAFGGFTIFLPTLLGNLGDEKNAEMQEKLRKEVRDKVGVNPENLSFESVKEMELVQSFVYETLRLTPPVPSQYARARKDFKLSSHDSVYEIKKGELLCGYQPLVMKDPKVFDEPEKFVLERFTKEKGKELLNYLFWSNGPQTGRPTESNKQCSAKDIVTLTASLIVAYIFQKYDSVSFSSGSLTSVKKAS
ncbi:fatty acid hydroperoxide lyase [Solanum tuberosum]|uniref:Fatty acid hydroperoxide lyase n=1 Tax=Solanum tuberosum TaxID=4113 RepID=C7ENW3_SOLTU|nr:fatty acid hydroperoxide lyase [Solanum tuberosum]ACT64589.1 fatty acid hydroperoxide lyase [Solanum tuberosum]